ncbi:MAG: sulfur oxidation c-type cytochrome SoxX [Gammaproteobacteria bacterium]|nr:sulfur oxidation c-type cytochrome SoxX [Gammaproteobacteria bacterium]
MTGQPDQEWGAECTSRGASLGPAILALFLLSPSFSTRALAAGDSVSADMEPYYEWTVKNLAITTPIGGRRGNAARGRLLSTERKKGNCIACHALPIPEAEFPGEIGPPLMGVGKRLSEGEIRLRIVDAKQVNPATIMPGYYRNPKYLKNVKKKFRGKTLLTAQEIEDLVAYLVTLK